MKNILNSISIFLIFFIIGMMIQSNDSNVPETEDMWNTTSIDIIDVQKFISNDKCIESDRYFMACISGINSSLKKFDKSLDLEGNIIDSVPEKEDLNKYTNSSMDFDLLLLELQKLYTLNNQQFHYGTIINSFLSILYDPHTYIIPMEKWKGFKARSRMMGISLGKTKEHYYIKRILKDSVAYQDYGLRAGDQIISINNRNVIDLNRDEIMKELGSESPKISLLRKEGLRDIQVSGTLRKELPMVSSEILPNNIGYISLVRFYENTCEDVSSIVKEFIDKKVSSIILDLRDNGGGFVSQASCISNMFLPKDKLVFGIRYLNMDADEKYVSEDDPIYTGKVVVLINNTSASASEIVAISLKDHNRATIIGQNSYGKGTVQDCTEWKSSIALCQTSGMYYSPKGYFPQLVGVIPHIMVRNKDVLNNGERFYPFPIQPLVKQRVDSPRSIVDMVDHESNDPELFVALEELGTSRLSEKVE